jgi:outer membrane protein TolC
MEAKEALNTADAKIGLARTGYYPDVDISADYTRLGPTSVFDIPNLGSFKLFPEDNYNISLNLRENVYDFGKTSANVDLENENKELASKTLDQMRQKLTLTVINTFYSLVYLQDAIKIKDEELANLNEHLEFVTKKNETGSSIKYEILTTKVKISTVESQKIDLQASRKIQLSILNSLLGQKENTELTVKKELNTDKPLIPEDSLVSVAVGHRDEVAIAKEKAAIAELRYKAANTHDNPSINIFASGGWKNGYIPDLTIWKANYVAGVGVKIPLFDASRTKNELLVAQSYIQSSNYDTQVISRNISNEVIENSANLAAADRKVGQFDLQLHHAKEAFELAKVNFQAGGITNLDLLDAATTVSESSLMLLKAKIDYVQSIYRLKAALGERLYKNLK